MNEEDNGLFYCPHCGLKRAVWQSDFSAEDCGYENDGIVQYFQCGNCRAFIEVYIPLDIDEDGAQIGLEQ